MHKIFRIPEIVTTIVTSATEDHDLLRSFLGVNHSFSREAIRILWDGCGTEYATSNWRRNKPTVRTLANIASHNVLRAQVYASCIRKLCFVRCAEDWLHISEGEQWHDHLLALKFPILESFTSDGRTTTTTLRTIVPGSELDTLSIKGPFYAFRSPEREGLFWHVLRSSPVLKVIDLALDEPECFESVEAEAMEFIRTTPKLSSLSISSLYFVWHGGVDYPNNVWRPGILSLLAALPRFRKLQGQNLIAKSLQNLHEGSFPALKELETNYTGSISILPSLFPQLSVLNLTLLNPNNEGLGRLACLSYLTHLSLKFAEGSTFSGSDLIALAHGCPHLTSVNIPSPYALMFEDPCLRGEDINDITIEAFARALPNLKALSIGLEDRSALTHHAVFSLARYCPNLYKLHITADISMPELIDGLKSIRYVPLQSMMFMHFCLPEQVEHKYEDASSLAEQLVHRLAPTLKEFTIGNGSESDIELQELVHGLMGVSGSSLSGSSAS